MAERSKMTKIDIHADDYALSPQVSSDILTLMKRGALDSISIVPNMSCFDECAELLKKEIHNLPFLPVMSVHINLVEGKRLSGEEGLIPWNWSSLWLASVKPGHGNMKREIRDEVTTQVNKTQKFIGELLEIAKKDHIPCRQERIRLDSHQHTHMIPLVWEALSESISENDYNIEYIRNSKEPFTVFFSEPSLLGTYKPVNFIKNLLLNLYSGKVDRFSLKRGISPMYLWGLVMSGRMDEKRVIKLLEPMAARASAGGRVLEILFHPGLMKEEEVNEEVDRGAADDFYLDKGRKEEYEAVLALRRLKL